MPLRILAVYGTRREGMKLAPVVEALRADADFEVKVCSTSRQGALAQDLADVFDLRPDWDLDLWHEGDDLYRAVAGVIEGLRDVLREARPDWVIIQGDTTSAFASALGAFYAGAKIAHVGGGLRTGDMADPFPEEGHRTMATRLASLHLAATARARAALKAEGIHPGKVEVTGSPIVDTLRKALALEAPLDADLAAWTEGRKLAVLTVRRSDRLGAGAAGVAEAIRALHDREAALRWALVLRRDHAPSDILRA
ncbi:MAG: UDP-N-acetylglucosamine 2-epimerase, partial [Planctomycetes bacterium]|nr:UDP-N-acetylglucosamine 2-epimerase [Planctomycetota bacterium]